MITTDAGVLLAWLTALVCLVLVANALLALAVYALAHELRDGNDRATRHNARYHPDPAGEGGIDVDARCTEPHGCIG